MSISRQFPEPAIRVLHLSLIHIFASRVELRAHLCRIVLDVAAALSLHLGTQLGLFKVGICQDVYKRQEYFIIGEGVMKPVLEEKVRELELDNVHILPYQPLSLIHI